MGRMLSAVLQDWKACRRIRRSGDRVILTCRCKLLLTDFHFSFKIADVSYENVVLVVVAGLPAEEGVHTVW